MSDNQSNPFEMFERACCITVSLGRPGTRKKVGKGNVKKRDDLGADRPIEVDADVKFVHVSKDLLQSDELVAVQKKDGEIRRYMSEICLPSPMFKGGVYLTAFELVERVDDTLQRMAGERAALVDAACEVYPTRVEEARAKLGPLFQVTDYPSPERFRAAFVMDYSLMTIGVPDALERISRTIYEREKENAARRVTDAVDEIQSVLLTTLQELVAHLVERTTPDATGKVKTFRNTLVSNLTGFLETFSARNITNFTELEALAQQAREVLAGVDVQALRTQGPVRDYVRNQMVTIKANLDQLAVARPTRGIRFADEPVVDEADAEPAGVAA